MSFLDYTFFQYALVGLVIISIAGSMIGTYITTRRMVSITGGITHACFGGLGLGYFLGISPVITAAVFAVASALESRVCLRATECAKTPLSLWCGRWAWP